MSTLYISVDIEKAGPSFKHHINAIGVVVGTETGEILDKREIFLQPPTEDLRPLLVPEFEEHTAKWWSQFPKILSTIQGNAMPLRVGLKAFNQFIEDVPKRWPNRKILWVCDNSVFDMGAIDYNNIVLGLRDAPIRNSRDYNDYYSIMDPSGDNLSHEKWMQLSALADTQTKALLLAQDSDAHFPMYDAMKNYFLWLLQVPGK